MQPIKSFAMKKGYLLLLSISFIISSLTAQVSVNSDGSEADASAMLDVVSTTKGMLVPRMTTTQRTNISNAASGLLVFDKTTASFWFYKTGSGWEELIDESSSVSEINNLNDAVSDEYNVFLGRESGISNTGENNTSTGIYSLFENTTGHDNTALGYNVLNSNISGTDNTATGSYALTSNTLGQYNVGFGVYSLVYNQEGSNNTAIGYAAGMGNGLQNITGNIFIGYMAGYNATGDNKLYIENSSSSTPLIGGDFDSDYVDINGDLNVLGSIKVAGGSPGEDKVLTSDASGNATWEDTGTPTAMGIDDLTDGRSDGYSLFLGYNSGSLDDGGNVNTAIGIDALSSNISGIKNTATGYEALNANDTGVCNTAIGYYALNRNETSKNNTAVGANSLQDNTADNNTALGYKALFKNSSGTLNTAVGSQSLMSNTTGGSNTAIGMYSLYNNYSGSNNTAIGKSALYLNSDGDNNTAIGMSSLTNCNNGANNTAIGTNSLYLNTSSNNIAVGYNSLYNNSSGTFNTAIGVETLKTNDNGYRNTAIGYQSLKNSTSDNNTAFGFQALLNNSIGEENFASGTFSLLTNTSGSNNTATGSYSLYSNTSGGSNSAYGYSSLYKNTYGEYNCAYGYSSLYNNETGYRNAAVGYNALLDNTTGNSNTAVGNFALENNTTGEDNTAIGSNSGPTLIGLDNTTAIGCNAIPTESNRVRIGNTSITRIGGEVGWSTLSDKRFKNQIKENVAGLEFIMKLRPVTYHLDVHKLDQFLGVEEKNPDEKSKRAKETIQYTGFIAQEVEQAAQEVNYDFSGLGKPQNEKDHYALAYAEFVVPLVKAVQEQQKQIEKLLKENEEIKMLLLELNHSKNKK